MSHKKLNGLFKQSQINCYQTGPKLSIVTFWIMLHIVLISSVVQWATSHISELCSAFLYFTLHSSITSPQSSVETVTWLYYCFPAIIPIMPPTWDYLSYPIVSWLCQDPDQVTFPLPLSYFTISMFYFWVFYGHSSAPHHYYCPIFHVFPTLLFLLCSLKFLSIKICTSSIFPIRGSPPLTHFKFKFP